MQYVPEYHELAYFALSSVASVLEIFWKLESDTDYKHCHFL